MSLAVSMRPLTDAELIRRAQREPEALGELFRRHSLGLERWLERRVPPSVAVELTAEVFAQAAVSLRRFRDDADGSARPWLLGIARNLLGRYLEKEAIDRRGRLRLGIDPASFEGADSGVERIVAPGERGALRQGMADLPREQRRAVWLRVVDELEYEEVARRLDCSPGAARVRVLRGLTALRARMASPEQKNS